MGRICRKYIESVLKVAGRFLEKVESRQRENCHYCQDAPSLTRVTTDFPGNLDNKKKNQKLWGSLIFRDIYWPYDFHWRKNSKRDTQCLGLSSSLSQKCVLVIPLFSVTNPFLKTHQHQPLFCLCNKPHLTTSNK